MHTPYIPQSFNLGSVVQTVDMKPFIHDDNVGNQHTSLSKINIALNCTNEPIPVDSQENTFYHELVHAILGFMAEHDLRHNEKFVQTFGNLLYEFEKTKV